MLSIPYTNAKAITREYKIKGFQFCLRKIVSLYSPKPMGDSGL